MLTSHDLSGSYDLSEDGTNIKKISDYLPSIIIYMPVSNCLEEWLVYLLQSDSLNIRIMPQLFQTTVLYV